MISLKHDSHIEQRIQSFGLTLWNDIRHLSPGFFNQKHWHTQLMNWAMKDDSFKINLFRFVDVLPSLDNSKEVSDYVSEYFLSTKSELSPLLRVVLTIASSRVTSGLTFRLVKAQVRQMSENFIVGETPQSAVRKLEVLHKKGIAFTADLLGESTVSDMEADHYRDRYFSLINTLADAASKWPNNDLIDKDDTGLIPRVNVPVKPSSLGCHLDPLDLSKSVEQLKKRVLPILLHAKKRHIFVNFDLEQWALHDITFELLEEILKDPALANWPHIGIVVQAYLKKSEEDLERLIKIARARSTPITVRLVKGAYWDYETVISRQNGFACPVFPDKAATDLQFEHLTRLLFENRHTLTPAIASHNLRSLSCATVLAKEMNVPQRGFEFQMIYGMAEPIRDAFCDRGYRVRLYSPIGKLLPGMAYLVRRLLENTSNEGFLCQAYHSGIEPQHILARPISSDAGQRETPRPNKFFQNCPLADFTDTDVRNSLSSKVDAIRNQSAVKIPICVGGKMRFSVSDFERLCPSDQNIIAAHVSMASVQDANAAVEKAYELYPRWRDTKLGERARLLRNLAKILNRDRWELAAMEVMEVAKPFREADADVAEAIDFCNFYADRAESDLAYYITGNVPGEKNRCGFRGRGPAVIISPWNFPLAILTGMSSAALVAGNPVILKPAEQSSMIGYALYTRMIEAGFSSGVVQFLPGFGEIVGQVLVEHPLVALIAFTGSKDVGLSILQSAAIQRKGQPQVKKVICEMGGKNAIIVDSDADLDVAIEGILKSAFSFSGQKCSACSHVVVLDPIYKKFVSRLIDACRSLKVASAFDPGCHVGPVVDRDSYDRLMQIIENPGPDATKLYSGSVPTGGLYVPPTLFEVNGPDNELLRQELFGPVLVLTCARSFEEAIETTTDTEFA
ncbi:MAG: proline dehydrogenase family protein, partial [Candidatus Lindowbacteria bacterium]|nr:proline dehydrogenase family protein [Candidatus Lindowbacteria bacterium]